MTRPIVIVPNVTYIITISYSLSSTMVVIGDSLLWRHRKRIMSCFELMTEKEPIREYKYYLFCISQNSLLFFNCTESSNSSNTINHTDSSLCKYLTSFLFSLILNCRIVQMYVLVHIVDKVPVCLSIESFLSPTCSLTILQDVRYYVI